MITLKMLLKSSVFEAVLFGLLAFLITFSELFYSADTALKDSIYQKPRGISRDITIIKIDDKTLSAMGPFGTWSRDVSARLVEILNSDKDSSPTVIAFDVLYFGEIEKTGDKAFSEACEKSGNVITGSYVLFDTRLEKDLYGNEWVNNMHISSYELPYDSLKEVTTQGFTNTPPDADGIIRSSVLSLDYNGKTVNSFALEVYSSYCDTVGISKNEIVTEKGGRLLIDYASNPGEYASISLIDILDGTVNPKETAGDIVLVGAYAQGLQDNFGVPVLGSEQMYGVEVHANIIQALMENRSPLLVNKYLLSLVTAALAGIIYYIIKQSRILISTAAMAASIIGVFAVGILLYNLGYIISLLYLPIMVTAAYISLVVRRYAAEVIARRRVIDAFRKYVAPQVVERISKHGDFKINLGGENKHIAVLFVDIRGFTPLSESLEPEKVVEILNEYLNLTTKAIFNNGGTLDKFIGDAAMAVFNAPFELDDYIYKAVCAAWDIVCGSKKLGDRLEERFGKKVGFGVGVNCGNAVVGNIGCDFRMDYTAIGDTVNTAARLESNAKAGQVLISEDVYNAVRDRISVSEIGEIPLKGKSKGVFVYSLEDIKEAAKNESIISK